MKEQSHKNEMSAAIRGDFKRLRDRGVAATLAPRDDDDLPEPVEIAQEPEVPEDPDEPEVRVIATARAEPDVDPRADEDDEPGDPDPPGFLSRLFGR